MKVLRTQGFFPGLVFITVKTGAGNLLSSIISLKSVNFQHLNKTVFSFNEE